MFLRCIHLQTVLVIVASVDSQLVEVHPPNIGVQTNEQNVVLSCNVTGLPQSNFIVWMYYPPWMTTGFLIYSTFDGINRDPTNFTINHSTLGTDTQSLELVINSAKRELATQYMCTLTPSPGFGKTVNVVVLDPVECPSSIIEYDVGNTTNISCSVNYYDSTLTYAPNVMWYRDGQLVPGQFTIEEANNRRTAKLIKSVTLADDDQEFVCIVDFMDSNPNYTDNCSTTFYVRHAASGISFYPPSNTFTPNSVAVGDVINCTADGKPAPSILWVDNSGNLLSDWGELFVTEDMRAWEQPIIAHCRANNIVTIEPLDGIYTFNVVEAKSTVLPSKAGPMLSVYPPSVSPEIGQQNVVLRCSVSGMPPNTNIEWIYYPTWYPTGITIYSTYDGINTDPINFTVQPTTLVGDMQTLDLMINTLKREFVTQYMCRLWPITDVGKGINVLEYLSGSLNEVSFSPPSRADAPTVRAVGDAIQCRANGPPDPTIGWYNTHGDFLSGRMELIVTVDMRSWEQPIVLYCRARNTIDNGVTFQFASGNYTFYVAEAVGQSSETEAWVIAVAVIVPIVVMAAIAVAVFFIIRRREMEKESTTKTTTASNAALSFQY